MVTICNGGVSWSSQPLHPGAWRQFVSDESLKQASRVDHATHVSSATSLKADACRLTAGRVQAFRWKGIDTDIGIELITARLRAMACLTSSTEGGGYSRSDQW